MKYRVLFTVAILCVTVTGCSTKKSTPEFERKWKKAVAESGLSDVQVIDTRASALKGNVQRLGAPTPPAAVAPSRVVPIKLTQNQVGRYIRRQLARLNTCQAIARGRSGKALLTVTIEASGRVSGVEVDAPAFRGTRMSNCLREGALRWRFPTFKKGPLNYTYPFLFR